ncbi:Phage tail assembly chaperone protein [uncultured Caudovirales phage]|uniref:Phage tail assembly chaperone protein n=1 Tax=uncultured Caudovirales phage TaxID=2100421 RepID=A0A6J5MLI0_9CAUD|nr:Phage tail assembly chaperone protein [uncultured Caudovirales phage]
MQVRIRTTGAVMYEAELRAWLHENDGPSYDMLTPEVMEAIGVDPVFEGPQATGGTVYQYSQRDGVEQISGNWYTKYILGPVFTDKEAEGDQPAQTAAEQEAAYKATKDAEQSASVRTSRNDKLAQCDWTQLADSTADKTTWATYRQALRDVTVQEGFPWNVTWPVEP